MRGAASSLGIPRGIAPGNLVPRNPLVRAGILLTATVLGWLGSGCQRPLAGARCDCVPGWQCCEATQICLPLTATCPDPMMSSGGGAAGSRGDSATGGTMATGGTTGRGGIMGSAGSASTGGTSGTGAVTATGGATSTGGGPPIAATGGATSTGGRPPIAATGGATGTGGRPPTAATGGATGTGGATPPPAVGAGVLAGQVTTGPLTALLATPVPGVTVTIDGPTQASAISDANGAFRFKGLPGGRYVIHPSKATGTGTGGAGAVTLTPPLVTNVLVVDDAASDTVQNFDCAYPCGSGPAIDPDRELFIHDPMVVTDPRASNAIGGPWSFRFLMEQMTWKSSPKVFANDWLNALAQGGRDVTALRAQWPTVIENGQPVPDMSRAPFQLLAIVNRLDLHAIGNGEVRFIYGIYPVPGAPSFNPQAALFTVSIEFLLPATAELPDRQAWARRFHQLALSPLAGDGSYNAALQSLTDLFTHRRTGVFDPLNPSGSNVADVRINERFRTDEPFQLRQFRLEILPGSGAVALVPMPLPQTPDMALSGMGGVLSSFVSGNAALLKTGFAPLPTPLLATVSSAPAAPWLFPGITDESLRHAFAGQTCVGCHWSEFPVTPSSTFQVDPAAPAPPLGYVSTIELPRRIAFLQHLLECGARACAAGGIEMMSPKR